MYGCKYLNFSRATSDMELIARRTIFELEGEEGDTGNEYGSGDKPNLELPGLQGGLLDICVASGKPVVLVLMVGSAIYLDRAVDNAKATVLALYPGALGGRAIARMLFGKTNPEGKLPVTFYSEDNYLPDICDYSMKERTYRYMTKEPLFPFGFGLSYTTFDEKITKVIKNGEEIDRNDITFKHGDILELCVEVKNTGKKAGGVTVQSYISSGIDGAPVRQLKFVKKVHLKAGEKKKVKVLLDENAFALYDTLGKYVLNSGSYCLSVGDSQPDARSELLTGKKCETLSVNITEEQILM